MERRGRRGRSIPNAQNNSSSLPKNQKENKLAMVLGLRRGITAQRKKASSSARILPIFTVDRRAARPFNQQIYDGYRAAILRGDLRPGQQIPSSRGLAFEFEVSRFPVLHGYAQLQAEGYFEIHVGSGTFVSGSLPEQLMSVDRKAKESDNAPPDLAGSRLVRCCFLHFKKLHCCADGERSAWRRDKSRVN
jgi:DNA-binding transcriptional regulator YhcF (GntR family)